MSRPVTNSAVKLAVVAALALGLTIGLAGCGGTKTSSTPTATTKNATATVTMTAKQAFPLAHATLTTTAPDAKLLLVAAGGAITPTVPPVWQYLFGDPKTGTTYVAIVRAGKASSLKYGTTQLSDKEWAAVPATDAWKIDSDAAVAKARTVYPEATDSTAYILGFVSYIPKAEKSVQTPPMVWSVSFDPSSRTTSSTSTVNVDAVTGAASLAK